MIISLDYLQMRVLIFFYSLTLCLSQLAADKQINKYVTTLINAKWRETPIALEVAEYLSDESQDYFWGFVDELSSSSNALPAKGKPYLVKLIVCCDMKNFRILSAFGQKVAILFYKMIETTILLTATDRETYNAVIKAAEKFLTPAEIAVLKLGLSLRSYSARVEMFNQMAENKNISNLGCDIVLDIGGRLTCSLKELEDLINEVCPLNLYSLYIFMFYFIVF